MLLNQTLVVFCFVFRSKSATQFFSYVHVCFVLRHVQFYYFSILVLLMSVLCSAIEVLFSFFVFVNFSHVDVCFVLHHVKSFVFVNFSNTHWFLVKIKVSDWVERNFFSLTVLAGIS